jgi:hypothetical protein
VWKKNWAGQGGRGRVGRPGKKTWEILGYGFQDMVFRTWNLNFGAWEILGCDFQDMVFRTWGLNFEGWEILGYGFQDLRSQLWGLDFHTRGF